MSEATDNSAPKLVRGLGLLDAGMIVVGSMIGSGIFLVSAESSRLVGAPGWLLVAWALAGLLTLTGALCCAELAAMWPRAGGQYVFLREAYGPSLRVPFWLVAAARYSNRHDCRSGRRFCKFHGRADDQCRGRPLPRRPRTALAVMRSVFQLSSWSRSL